MKILPFTYAKVAEGLHVRISNHFHYSHFGVLEDDAQSYHGRRYIMWKNPGTGFVERESDSQSYHRFVRKRLAKQYPRYWRLLLGKEPDFDREMALLDKVLVSCGDPRKRQILEYYQNTLALARTEERLQRIVRGIKNKLGRKSNKFLVSVMSHYKSKIAHLEKEVRNVELDVSTLCSPETYAAYKQVVEAFKRVASCRRTWHYDENARHRFKQVFFDVGIFNFIHCPSFLPIMRDPTDKLYVILPDAIAVVRSSVDFDLYPLKDLTIIFQELSIEEPVETLSYRLGDAASQLKIPSLDLTFYFNHVRPIAHFVECVERLKATL